jgi:hypothetical protein
MAAPIPAIYRFFTEHLGGEPSKTFVSRTGEVWFDPANNEIRFSDGITPGGQPLNVPAVTVASTSITTPTLNASNINIQGISSDNYTLDDISNATDGFKNTFTPTFNQQTVSFNSPYNLEVTINGLIQSPFNLYSDIVWQSMFVPSNKGFTLDPSGNIKFANSVPKGSNVIIRTRFGSIKSIKNIYPFKAVDILMGY